jgi:hypothetical protein
MLHECATGGDCTASGDISILYYYGLDSVKIGRFINERIALVL